MNKLIPTKKNKIKSNNRPPTLILTLLGFVFVFATIGLINDISTWKGIRPFGALSDVFAQVSGFALNTKKISKQLDGGGNLLESNDRCQVIDPNKAEIKTASQLSRLALPSLEGNMGGANTAIVLDGGYDSELNEKILKYASDLDMSYNLGMVTVNSSTSQEAAAQFIKDTNALGMLPIIRLCYAGSCGFKDQNQIIDFYKNVHSLTSSEEFFVGIIGPNEPGSGEPEIEMKGFVDGLNYDALLNETNDVAKALQGLRPGGINAGHMLIAPAVFNLTNSVNNDVKEYLYSGRTFNPEYYDYLIGNTYELSVGVSAYDFYANGAQTDGNNSLKIYADGKDIPVIVSEFGAFFENYQGRRQTAIEEQKQSFAKFCQDGNVEGVLFFRSFLNENGSVALNDELVWKDRHGMTPSEHAEIIGDCPVQKKAGFKDFSWANCNFDSCLYPKEYSTNSTATACGTEIENRTFNLENGAALKVVPDGDHYVTKKIGTVEVSMPIKQFGSNSSAGTSSLPYTPICAEVAAYYANSEVDPLNQFAGVLKNADGSTTYAMPWLGSAINCSAELILASQEFARLNDKANLNPGSSSLETFKELSSKDNPFGTEYWEEYFSLNGGKSIYPVPWNNVNKTIQDEKALCIDSLGYCLDKGVASDTINGLRDYLPQNTPSRYRQTSCSSNAIYLENQSNYIIGPEVVVEPASEVWRGTGSEVCRKYANRKNTDKDVLAGVDYPNQLGGVLSEQYQAAALDCKIENKSIVANGSSFYCPDMVYYKSFNYCSNDKIQKGECSIPAEYAECLKYNPEAGDEIYIKTDKWPDAPNYSIPGVYDSLYRMYQRLQTQMSERGLKMVFRENLGWKVEVTSKVRDASRPLAESNDRGLPDVIPYRYSQDLDSCEVPTNIFDNGTLLAKTNPTKTEYQYYDWLGYLDILQELSSAYTKDSTFSAEKLIDNANYGKTNAANNTRRKVLETGLASITTSFPVLSCDQIEQWKFDENPVQSSSTDSSNQPSTQYYCPIEAGLCAKGPDVESHEGLKAIDLFSANYKDGEQNVIAPFDGKIVTAQKGNEFSYCDNGTKSGGRIYFEGKIDGKTVKLMFLHVLVDDSVKVGNEYKAGQRITRVSKLSDDDITSVDEGGCIGKDGPHLHMEIEEGQYKNNIVDFTKALGCNMQGATGLGYGDFDNYGDTCNARSNITLGAQGEVGASTSASLVLNPDAQIKPDDKLTCITDTSDKRFNDELGEFLCSKGYAIEGLCDNACVANPAPEEEENDSVPTNVAGVACPLKIGTHQCSQGPKGNLTHCQEGEEGNYPLDLFPSFPAGRDKNADAKLPVDESKLLRELGVYAPESGTIKVSQNNHITAGYLGDTVELKGSKSGITYYITHLEPESVQSILGSRRTVEAGEKIAEICTQCSYGYKDWHIHISAFYGGKAVDPYLLYGEIMGCNAKRPEAGAVFGDVLSSAGYCAYGGKLDDNYGACVKTVKLADNDAIIKLFDQGSTQTPDNTNTPPSGATNQYCEAAICKASPKNGVTYESCPGINYNLCDDQKAMTRMFSNLDPSVLTDESLTCEERAQQIGSSVSLESITFLGVDFRVNSKIVPQLKKVEQYIKSQALSSIDEKTYAFPSGQYTFVSNGAFNPREIRGEEGTEGCQFSNHSWGTALDLNATTNPYQPGGGACLIDMPPEVVKAFERFGFRWGGRYGFNFDPMHFEYCVANDVDLGTVNDNGYTANICKPNQNTSTDTNYENIFELIERAGDSFGDPNYKYLIASILSTEGRGDFELSMGDYLLNGTAKYSGNPYDIGYPEEHPVSHSAGPMQIVPTTFLAFGYPGGATNDTGFPDPVSGIGAYYDPVIKCVDYLGMNERYGDILKREYVGHALCAGGYIVIRNLNGFTDFDSIDDREFSGNNAVWRAASVYICGGISFETCTVGPAYANQTWGRFLVFKKNWEKFKTGEYDFEQVQNYLITLGMEDLL